jgi:hypothetical protein
VEADPILRAVERNSLLAGAAITVAALFVPPRPHVAVGAAAGSVLVFFSYWSLKRGVSMLAELMAGDAKRRGIARMNRGRELRNVVFRYALLVLLAYVMIARLRLHPWGLLAGASSVVAGVSIEAFRLVFWKKS